MTQTTDTAALLAELGFTLTSTPPTSGVDKDWPHIAYTIKLEYKGREVLSTPYKLGVGHVKPISYDNMVRFGGTMTPDEENTSHHWARGMRFNLKDARTAQLQASTAAKLATMQKVKPTLADVLHNLLSDGEAFFNADSFEDWATGLGYDTDSRDAERIYAACNDTGRKLARGIPAAVLAQVRGLLQDY